MKNEMLMQAYQPFWNNWYISNQGLLGTGSFAHVYKLYRDDMGVRTYAAMKVISCPHHPDEVQKLENQGYTREEIIAYYEQKRKEVYKEITLMETLKGKSYILSYEDFQVFPQESGIGYHICIRMELAESLENYITRIPMTAELWLRMGRELCQGLMLCKKHGIVHRDIKPANIFISKDDCFMLGDFGIASCAKDKITGIRGSYNFMAPEIYRGDSGDERSDIYSLGLVLYYYCNHNQIPFLPYDKKNISHTDYQKAFQRRMAGEVPQWERDVPYIFQELIGKAIAYSPENRYQNATEFYHALMMAQEKYNAEQLKESWGRTFAIEFEPPKRKDAKFRVAGIVALFVCVTGIASLCISRLPISLLQSSKLNQGERIYFVNSNQEKISDTQEPKENQNALVSKKIPEKQENIEKAILVSVTSEPLYAMKNKTNTNVPVVTEEVKSTELPVGTEVVKDTNAPVVTEEAKSTELPVGTEVTKGTNAPVVTEVAKNRELPVGTETAKNTNLPSKIASASLTKKKKAEKNNREQKLERKRSKKISKKRSKQDKKTTENRNTQLQNTLIPQKALEVESTVVPKVEKAEQLQVPSSLQMKKNACIQLPIMVRPKEAKVQIVVKDTSIVCVEGTRIYAKKTGNCVITVKADDLQKNCHVCVTEH